jgi:spore coat protein E
VSGKLEYRQIITKAVCGKGRKFCEGVHAVNAPEMISSILGAWVINHSFSAEKVGEAVEVRGSYDINIWYSTKGNTRTDVIKEKVHYVEQVPLSFYDQNLRESSSEVSASVTQSPNCVEATLSTDRNKILIRIEKEFIVELIGETQITVAVYPPAYADYEEKELISGLTGIDEEDDIHFEALDPELLIDDLED